MGTEAFYLIPSLALAIIGIVCFILAVSRINRSKFEIEKKVLEAEKEREAILTKAKVKLKTPSKACAVNWKKNTRAPCDN